MSTNSKQEIKFIGKITAGSTHEMKNVLATINESAGLMRDIIALSKDAAIPHREKFERALTVIEAQVQRGTELSTQLNRFAHRTDVPVAQTDLQDLLEHLAFLSQRFVRLKNATLNIEQTSQPLMIEVRPIRALMVLLGCIEYCLAHLPPGAEIIGAAGEDAVNFVIEFRCQGETTDLAAQAQSASTDPQWVDLAEDAKSFGGVIELDPALPGVRVRLSKASD
jgi:signal transduction histidine kinase